MSLNSGQKPPNKYETLVLPRLQDIPQMVDEGKSEREIAVALGVAFCTLRRYRKQYPELDEALARKSKWEALVLPHLEEIPKMCCEMTQGQIADALGISRSMWDNYKAVHPELKEALAKGKETLVQELKVALRKKALGFQYDETKTTQRRAGSKTQVTVERFERYSPPDLGAIHLLLKNNDPEWRNDDFETMELKKKQVDIAQQKADDQTW